MVMWRYQLRAKIGFAPKLHVCRHSNVSRVLSWSGLYDLLARWLWKFNSSYRRCLVLQVPPIVRCSVCDTGGVGRGHAKQGCQSELMSWTKRPCDSFEPFVSTAQAAELQKLLDKGSQDSAFFCRLSQSEQQSDPVGSNRPFDSGRVSECMAESALRLLSTYVGAAHPLFPILLNFSFGQVSERQRPSLEKQKPCGGVEREVCYRVRQKTQASDSVHCLSKVTFVRMSTEVAQPGPGIERPVQARPHSRLRGCEAGNIRVYCRVRPMTEAEPSPQKRF